MVRRHVFLVKLGTEFLRLVEKAFRCFNPLVGGTKNTNRMAKANEMLLIAQSGSGGEGRSGE